MLHKKTDGAKSAKKKPAKTTAAEVLDDAEQSHESEESEDDVGDDVSALDEASAHESERLASLEWQDMLGGGSLAAC